MARFLVLLFCTLLATAATVRAEDLHHPVGLVKTASGDASILRDGRLVAAQPGFPLHQSDVLFTGPKGTMGVILRDDTILFLGPWTETRLEQFAFEPAEHKLGMVARFKRHCLGDYEGVYDRLR
jgi:hypothetical protein